jgi:Protein of unknown function (DUF3987)
MGSSKSKEELAADAILEKQEEALDTPLIPDLVYQGLPRLLKEGCDNFLEFRERDMFLTGSLVLLSGCLPNYSGIYDQRKVYPNFYAMVAAPPASGKGVLVQALNYVNKIQQEMKDSYAAEKEKYDSLMKKTDKDKNEKAADETPIKKPVFRRLIIPGNSSSSALMTSMNNSGGSGIIFETEADTLVVVLKQEWGNYSDILRKAYHHEPVSSSRKGESTEIDIREPKLSCLISGTYDQIGKMTLNNPKNGLQSRFLFYIFNSVPTFKKVSPHKNKQPRKDSLEKLGKMLKNVYDILKRSEHEFVFTTEQWEFYHRWFNKKMKDVVKDYNEYAGSMIARLALTGFRIASILSMLRSFENGMPNDPVQCTWQDFRLTLHMLAVYLKHNLAVFQFSEGGGVPAPYKLDSFLKVV